MKVGFIMVNYNDYEQVSKMIEQIKVYQIIDTIIVVDNASTDQSLFRLKQILCKNLVILENRTNAGYGAGINLGIRYLNKYYKDSYAFISNTDIIIDGEDDLKKLISNMKSDIAIVAPIIKECTGYRCGWKIPTPWQDIFLSIPYIHKNYQKKLQYQLSDFQEKCSSVEAVSGSFFLINSRDLESAGYFDENIFLYYEENILAKKLQKIHKKTKVLTSVKVFHNHSVTVNRVYSNIQKYKNLKKSQYYFQTRYNHAGIMNRMTMKILFQVVEFGLYIKNKLVRYNKND